MATLRKVPVLWNTGAGGPGVSVFYTLDPDDVTTELATFINAIKGLFPSAVSWQIPSSGDLINEANNQITGAWTGGTAASIAATGGGGAYAAGTGAYVRWQTGTVHAGRRVKGRTFLCPLLASVYDNDGTITGVNLVIFQNAANTLVSAGKHRVYSRPGPTISPGFSSAITGALVPDRVTSLRSRRI